jgi:hypothetical protein
MSGQVLTLTNVVKGLRMLYNFDFQNEVDTYGIEIRVKRDEHYIPSLCKRAERYMLYAVDSATCFGDEDNATAMSTPIYPGTKGSPAFLCMNNCPPPCTSPYGCIGVYSGIGIRSVALTPDRTREDEGHHAWCDQASYNWF